MRIEVRSRGETTELQVPPGAKLLSYLQEAAIPVNAACGGNGSCHKCRVKVEQGFLGITSTDRKAFRESELTQGWRLSCQAQPKTAVSVFLPSAESVKSKPRVIAHDAALERHRNSELVLVCDLGSTGVVVAIAAHKGPVLMEAHLLNRQVRFGADVMTRLHAAQNQGVGVLQKAIDETLLLCCKAIEEKEPDLFKKASAQGMVCSGNSAMTSFLHGWDISSLAVSPFQPVSRDASESEHHSLRCISLPLLAGFVGGDTVAGILAVEARGAEEPWMLVDVGTNTEIVINNGRGELWLSSAPAGPAFEGGNIAQGMRAETGAISQAQYVDGKWKLETIGGDVPKGVCGSGLIDAIYESVKASLILRDGYLPGGRLDLTPEISLLADDIREFQLAKSATRTAAELLMNRADIVPKKIFLAGTFAQHLKMDSVHGVGLLPPDIPAEAIGNASLEGAVIFASMTPQERQEIMNRLELLRRPVELALQDDFQDRFVKNLGF